MILNVLSKLGPKYAVFVFVFHIRQFSMEATYVDPSFDNFSSLLIQEKAQLIQMSFIKSSKPQALVASEPKVYKELGNPKKEEKEQVAQIF